MLKPTYEEYLDDLWARDKRAGTGAQYIVNHVDPKIFAATKRRYETWAHRMAELYADGRHVTVPAAGRFIDIDPHMLQQETADFLFDPMPPKKPANKKQGMPVPEMTIDRDLDARIKAREKYFEEWEEMERRRQAFDNERELEKRRETQKDHEERQKNVLLQLFAAALRFKGLGREKDQTLSNKQQQFKDDLYAALHGREQSKDKSRNRDIDLDR
jgi:type IV secretory pathway VirB10-like protein